jgi:hypothetical protein
LAVLAVLVVLVVPLQLFLPSSIIAAWKEHLRRSFASPTATFAACLKP